MRLAVPPLRIVGFPKPLDVFMDFDAQSVDAMIERLTVLRSQMLPPLPAPAQRNWTDASIASRMSGLTRHIPI